MLFSRVYNWIKYKTLPPSVLFLNRLFVERDSKHRRVTSNLGLTFRNSKWSTYARVNINLNSRTNYFFLLAKFIGFVALLTALIKFSNYYNLFTFTNYGYSVIWFLFDADLYMKVLFSSSLFCSIQVIFSTIYSNFLTTLTFNTSKTVNNTLIESESFDVPKRLRKPILYSWLTTNTVNKDISKLFNLTTSNSSNKSLLNLTHNLFKSANLLSRSDLSVTELSAILLKLELSVKPKLTTNLSTTFNPAEIPSSLDYKLFNSSPFKVKKHFFTECSYWTLESVQTELNKNSIELESINGLFYSSNLSYSKLNNLLNTTPELNNLRTSVDSQLSVIRWQRWLYKYNILHRASLKNSLYLTTAKRLINSGFYSSSLTTNNIWASSTPNLNSDLNSSASSLTYALFGDSLNLNNLNTLNLNPTTGFYNSNILTSLSFYELSYHWFIQRFYQLNNLRSNEVLSHLNLSKSLGSTLRSSILSYENSALSLNTNITSALKLPSSTLYNNVNSDSSTTSSAGTLSPNDLYLHYYDYSLFSKQRIEVLQNLVTNNSSLSYTFFKPNNLKGAFYQK